MKRKTQRKRQHRYMNDIEWRKSLQELLEKHRRRIEALVAAKQTREPFRQVYIEKTTVETHDRTGHWRTIVPRRAPVATKAKKAA